MAHPKTKHCKFCDSEMLYYSKVCPNCKKNQTNQKLKFAFLTCIVLAVIALAFMIEFGSPLGQQITAFMQL